MQDFCAICNKTTDWGRLFQKWGRTVGRCEGCGVWRTTPVPPADELTQTYEEDFEEVYANYVSHRSLREMQAKARMRWLLRESPPAGRLLDIGCATGELVLAAAAQGFEATGVDLCPPVVEIARQRGADCRCARVEAFLAGERKAFSVITAFDVIEHVRDPRAFARMIASALHPGGLFVFITPDCESLSRRLLGRRWFYFTPPYHVYTMATAHMRKVLGEVGLEVVRLGRGYKLLSFEYAAGQLAVGGLKGLSRTAVRTAGLLPRVVRSRAFRVPIGDMYGVARRR